MHGLGRFGMDAVHLTTMKHPLIITLGLLSLSLFGQPALKITPLTGDFYIFTTYQVYDGTPFPANGMYLVTSEGVALFDSPWDTTQFQPLLDSIKERHKADVVLCIATHSHEDRTGGLQFLRQQQVKTYTSRMTDELCQANDRKRAEFTFERDTVFKVGQYSFQTYYGGPGHTVDNIVIWFEKDNILYGGCLVKSVEATNLGYLGEANLEEYPKTIQKIKQKVGRPSYIIPGHQDWTSNEALDYTLKLLERR